MARNRLRTLIALNAALLVALIAVVFSPAASAQRGAAARARGNYTMVAGAIQGREEDAIYIIDVNNQELVAVYWDRNGGTLRPIGYRNLANDTQRMGGGR